jgi:hypothetical protein
MTCLRTTGRILLILLVGFLGCLWTLACFIITMTGVCVVGWCVNFSKGRTGGCSDEECKILSEGIETFKAYNSKGWQTFLSWIREEEPPHQEDGGRRGDMPEIRYPPPVVPRE